MSRATQDDTYRRQRSRKGLSPAAAPLSNGLRSDASLTCGGPTTPQGPEPLRFGLFPSRSPLLGESLLFSFPAGTKMFQFPAFASVISTYGCQVFNLTGFPIRRSAGQRSFAPHRSFSQLITSFIACGSLGIRHTPFSSFSYFVDMSHTHIIYKEGDTLSILSVLIPCHKKGQGTLYFRFSCFVSLCQRPCPEKNSGEVESHRFGLWSEGHIPRFRCPKQATIYQDTDRCITRRVNGNRKRR